MNPKIKLTPDLQKQILAAVRAGGYPHIAAQAFGVPDWLWERWLQWGRNKKFKEPYTSFVRQLDQAAAQARLKAEMAVLSEEPKLWLRAGPGKETHGNPGWTSVVKPLLTQDNRTVNLFGSQDFLQFMATLRAVLAPFPEALKALTSALEGKEEQPVPPMPIKIANPPDQQ